MGKKNCETNLKQKQSKNKNKCIPLIPTEFLLFWNKYIARLSIILDTVFVMLNDYFSGTETINTKRNKKNEKH